MEIDTSGENETVEAEVPMEPVHVPIEQDEIRAEGQETHVIYRLSLLFMVYLCIQIDFFCYQYHSQ